MKQRFIASLALALIGFGAHAQTTCPVPPADPIARDAARMTWQRPTLYTDNTAIPSTSVLTYTLYRRVGTVDTAICTTNATGAGQSGLAVGRHTFVVSAREGAGAESPKSNAASKTVAAPPPPSAPLNLTIAATQVGGNYTCRTAAGEVLTSHTTPHKAQEACTNQAVAHLGDEFRVQPDGYLRIVASLN
jgi:hypothetical protein